MYIGVAHRISRDLSSFVLAKVSKLIIHLASGLLDYFFDPYNIFLPSMYLSVAYRTSQDLSSFV